MSHPVGTAAGEGRAPRAAPAERRRLAIPSAATLGLPLVVLLIILLGGITNSDFLTGDNIRAMLLSAAVTGIVAVGMTMITLSGNFVSLGTQQSAMLGAIVFAAAVGQGWNVALVILLVVALLMVIGVAQGIIVSLGLNPVITTLAAGAIIYGTVASITKGEVVTFGGNEQPWLNADPLGIPLPIVVFGVVTAIASLIVSRTIIGRHMVLIGASRATAETSGISVRATTIWAFALFTVAVALAGILTTGQLGQANVDVLGTLTIDAIAAVLVGGTAIQGGEGSPLRSAVGAIIIALITNLMILNGFSQGGRQAAVGAVVVGVVIMLQILRIRGATR